MGVVAETGRSFPEVMVITGAHFLIYSRKADEDRRFLAETFGFSSVDAGEGWLIFALPPAELAVHPADESPVQGHPAHDLAGCVLYLMCDDLTREMAALARKGASCTPPRTAGWGVSTTVPLPSGGSIGLYQPTHPTAVGERR